MKLSAILGIADEPVELISVARDNETNSVRVEFIGPNGVEVRRYEADEARRVAADLTQWADEQEA